MKRSAPASTGHGLESTQKGLRRSPARKNTFLRWLERFIGRTDLLDALELSQDSRALVLAGMLCDPAYRDHSFGRLCERAGLRSHEILQIFGQAQVLKGLIEVLKHLPDICEDLAQDALSRAAACRRCDGKGEVKDDDAATGLRVCPQCKGAGQVMVSGDSEARKLLFDLVGLRAHVAELAAGDDHFTILQDDRPEHWNPLR